MQSFAAKLRKYLIVAQSSKLMPAYVARCAGSPAGTPAKSALTAITAQGSHLAK
jgi:hypothetical protein